MLGLGAKVIGAGIAAAVVETWMTTKFLADQEKYTRRVEKGRTVAARHLRPLDDSRL